MAPLILVIDDDPDILELYQQALTAKGYTVVCDTELLPSVQSIRRSRPALVIVDGLSADAALGLMTVRSLRMHPVTAKIPIQRYAHALAADGIAILYKPFYLDALLSLVGMLVSPGVARPQWW